MPACLRLDGRGRRAWVVILMWCFPCVSFRNLGAFDSSAVLWCRTEKRAPLSGIFRHGCWLVRT